MKVMVNCPDSTKIISIVLTGEKSSNIWATSDLLSIEEIEESNGITIPEPEEEQENE